MLMRMRMPVSISATRVGSGNLRCRENAVGVLSVPGGSKKFGGLQTHGEVHKKCCKRHGNQ